MIVRAKTREFNEIAKKSQASLLRKTILIRIVQFSSRNEHCNWNDELNQLSYRHFLRVRVNWIEFNCWRNVSENIGFIAAKDDSLNIGREIRRKQQSGKNYRKTKFHESTIKKKPERKKNLINAFNFILMICQAFQLWNFLKINWTNAECHLYFSYQMFAGKHSIRWNSPFDHFYDGNISSKKTLRKIFRNLLYASVTFSMIRTRQNLGRILKNNRLYLPRKLV